MKEATLLNIAIMISILGLGSIYAISNNIEISDTTIDKITSGETEETVKVTGEILSIRENNGVTQLVLGETTKIKAVIFSEDLQLEKGYVVEITGSITEYEGETEIIADTVTIV